MTLYNYIKAHRKRDGLNQQELSFLLGAAHSSTVSRIEQNKQRPSLEDMIVLEALFQKNASHLFPDLYQFVSNKLLYRLDLLQQHLEGGLPTQTNRDRLEYIRKARSSISEANQGRI